MPSALNTIPWFKLLSDTSIEVEVMQPSAPMLCIEIPFPFWTTSILPAVSKTIVRGFVRPPTTFVAFQPEASTDENDGFPAPAHDAGIAALAVLVGATTVVRVVDVGLLVADDVVL